MCGPLFSTLMLSERPSAVCTVCMLILMVPSSGVCLRALVKRLLMIFSSLSVSIHAWHLPSGMSVCRTMCFMRAESLKASMSFSISSVASVSATLRRRASASSWLKSSIWSMSLSMRLTLMQIRLMVRLVSVGRFSLVLSESNGPAMMVSGLRNSCEMLAKKFMFISLVRCSRSRSCCSCRKFMRLVRMRRYRLLINHISHAVMPMYSSHAAADDQGAGLMRTSTLHAATGGRVGEATRRRRKV